MKNQKGITLVALVVTIVVLLILAGITIAYVMQGDSIFGKAKQAATATNKDSVQSTVATAILELQAMYYDPATTATVDTKDEAKTELVKYVKGMTLAFADSDTTSFAQLSATKADFTIANTTTVTTATEVYTVSYTDGTLSVEFKEKVAATPGA